MTKLEVQLASALAAVLEDLKLRASLSDEPTVLDISHSTFLKAETAIQVYLECVLREDVDMEERNK